MRTCTDIIEQAPDVAPVLWRLVAPAVLRTADLGDAPLGVVADEAGAVVGVRQIVGDQSVHLGHELDRQLPARIERSELLATTGSRVFQSRVYPLRDADLPCLLISTDDEQIGFVGDGFTGEFAALAATTPQEARP